MSSRKIPLNIGLLTSSDNEKLEFYQNEISFSGFKKAKQLLIKFPPRTLAEQLRMDLADSIICQEDCDELAKNYVHFALEFPDTCMYVLPLHIRMKRAVREERYEDASLFRDQINRYQEIATKTSGGDTDLIEETRGQN